MTTSIHVEITPDQLKELIENTIQNCLNQLSPSNNKLLSADEAAAVLGIPKNTLYQLTSQRKIPFMKIGKRNLFEEAELISWARSNRKKTRDELESE